MSEITGPDPRKFRRPWKVTWDVWSALVLREFTARTTADRMGWFWMLFEPLATIVVMMFVRNFLRPGMRHMAGAEYVPWITIGLMSFYIFRECMMSPMNAINANKGMFSYKQILPVDTVIARCVVGGMLRGFIFTIVTVFMLISGILGTAYDPIKIIVSLMSLWLLGSSIGLLLAALVALVPEVGRVVRLFSMPMMFISGAVLPINNFPLNIKIIMTWNPLLIAIENVRLGFFQYYVTLQNLNDMYVWSLAILILSLGLVLHVRFASRFKMI